jgi:hypothetical protein
MRTTQVVIVSLEEISILFPLEMKMTIPRRTMTIRRVTTRRMMRKPMTLGLLAVRPMTRGVRPLAEIPGTRTLPGTPMTKKVEVRRVAVATRPEVVGTRLRPTMLSTRPPVLGPAPMTARARRVGARKAGAARKETIMDGEVGIGTTRPTTQAETTKRNPGITEAETARALKVQAATKETKVHGIMIPGVTEAVQAESTRKKRM